MSCRKNREKSFADGSVVILLNFQRFPVGTVMVLHEREGGGGGGGRGRRRD